MVVRCSVLVIFCLTSGSLSLICAPCRTSEPYLTATNKTIFGFHTGATFLQLGKSYVSFFILILCVLGKRIP